MTVYYGIFSYSCKLYFLSNEYKCALETPIHFALFDLFQLNDLRTSSMSFLSTSALVVLIMLGFLPRERVGDDRAKTREAKWGCVFTQTCVDREGRPVRDDDSTSYTGAIETAELFGRRIYQEAMRRGMNSAGETVVIGDGALWIWNIADEQFYGATQIVDLFHAREQL